MMNKNYLMYFLLLTLFLSACSSGATDQPAAATRVSSPEAQDSPDGQPTSSGGQSLGVLDSPLPWADLDLDGLLYFVGFIQEQQNLLRLNLGSGEESVIFDPPENAWLNEAAVSPDGTKIAMAYAPPPEEGQIQFGFTALYLMPSDGSEEPAPLLERAEASETFFNISWPQEEYIYYAHFAPSTDDLGSIVYGSQVERLHFPSGEVEVLAPAAAWPRLSKDGTRLAYVTEANEMIVSEADGSNPAVVLDPEQFAAVDAPLFSPDSNLLYFSAVDPVPDAQSSLWDRLLGVGVALAHSVPSDWWLMPADGSGELERLTNLNAIGLYGDFSASGEHIAFITAEGVNVMNPDGTNIIQLQSIPTTGAIDWVP